MSIIKGFDAHVAQANGQRVAYARGGDGPPVLLLHGFPQTHAMWHAVGPALAEHFTVIAPDLRGYGDSAKPEGTAPYSFREMAADPLALMRDLGFDRFHLVGHDRGGRTAHRMALDAPEAVRSLTVMDIVPTHLLLDTLSHKVARDYYHWFFLAQPAPLPESLIGHDPDGYFETALTGWGATDLSVYDPQALAAYRAAWRDPDTIRGMCADYRAALEIDMDLDAADLGRRVTCPALVMWGKDGVMARRYDLAATWADRLETQRTAPMSGGHFFVDEHPAETSAALLAFLLSVDGGEAKTRPTP
ncbi:Haloacetate dehalogenase H-1 [Sulfitobacter sp. THAF37]|uniref:alpha/beta fold hydrolase n=1 Tax=Sulfitobacter sp. THAF37 TaxID=2587855 RepID=UPI0012684473|nr:alpha/beta hydrolase [Sulfitobacter sp. THAF37]QFT59801.1 Haloacetate dehalogenase H-1 [Sulfitobacter sp. THAF37]